MKKTTLLLWIALTGTTPHALCQNNLGKTDDAGRISLVPVVSDEISTLPPEAKSLLLNKLQQVATLNGLGGSRPTPWFVITANVAVLTKDIVAGPPAMITQNLSVTFFIADCRQKTMLSTASVEIKGAGTNETKAYIDAIRNLKTTNPSLKLFVETGKQKIIEFYNTHCDFVLAGADVQYAQKQYREAIYTLTSVPEVCKDCYMKAMTAVGPIYRRYIDFQCQVLLNQARTDWMGNQNGSGADMAGRALAAIDPESGCYGEAKQLMDQIAQKVLEDEKRNFAFAMKVHDDKVDLEKQRIEAARAVGVAWGENQPQQVYNFKGWLW